MQHPYALACLWFGLALVATFLGTRLKVSNALMEITVGVVAGAAATAWFGRDALGAKEPWLVFVASTGAVVLTFLAGAELDPGTLRTRWREVLGVGLLPAVGAFRQDRDERWYYTLLMSTGLTFGTISALFGLSHGIVTQDQYSHLVAVVIASAVAPTLVAGALFSPRHLVTPALHAELARDLEAVSERRRTEPPAPLEEG
jgi:Kef-type K+ transport system membrane component KefB